MTDFNLWQIQSQRYLPRAKEVLIINMVIYIYDEIQEFHTLKLRIEKIEYDSRKF